MEGVLVSERPTLDLNKSTVLARDIVGEVVVELSKLPNGELLLDVTCSGEVLNITRHRDLTDFQAGRLFENEMQQWKGLVK